MRKAILADGARLAPTSSADDAARCIGGGRIELLDQAETAAMRGGGLALPQDCSQRRTAEG